MASSGYLGTALATGAIGLATTVWQVMFRALAWASRLLEARRHTEAAEVLARLRADDAADAVMELSQDRRRIILELRSRC